MFVRTRNAQEFVGMVMRNMKWAGLPLALVLLCLAGAGPA